MKIILSELTKDSVGKKVKYGKSEEPGTITSYNLRFVFVDYTNSGQKGCATLAEHLVFAE